MEPLSISLLAFMWNISLYHYIEKNLQEPSVLFEHTTTLFSLSDHYILSREWRVIVDQVQTNNHGRPMVL